MYTLYQYTTTHSESVGDDGLSGPCISSLASDHDCCSRDRCDDRDDQRADDQDGKWAGAAVLLANLAGSVQGVTFIAHA